MSTASSSESGAPARRKVVVLFGPTAVGKTAVIASLFSGAAEVVSADSMQVYRGLDIGTAKPEASLLAGLPHHLIDIRDPDEQFTAGDFVRQADRLVPLIAERGRLPIIAGGTGYYIRNYIYGLPATPGAFPEVRRRIRDEMERLGSGEMHRRLAAVDPAAANRIPPSDRYRIERALEVFQATGRPLSSYEVPTAFRECVDALLIGIERPLQELHGAIERRVDGMFATGLLREVSGLLSRGLGPEAPAMRGIGYREFFTMIGEGCLTRSDARDLIARDTRRYAKRQLTFFRGFPGVRWFHPDRSAEIAELVERFYR